MRLFILCFAFDFDCFFLFELPRFSSRLLDDESDDDPELELSSSGSLGEPESALAGCA